MRDRQSRKWQNTAKANKAYSKRNLTDMWVVFVVVLSQDIMPYLFLPLLQNGVEIKTLRATIIAASRDPVVGSRTNIRIANQPSTILGSALVNQRRRFGPDSILGASLAPPYILSPSLCTSRNTPAREGTHTYACNHLKFRTRFRSARFNYITRTFRQLRSLRSLIRREFSTGFRIPRQI